MDPDIAAVLGEELLVEVLVRLPGPDDLIRAAASCKPFLRAARNGPFLRRFRRLHPTTCPRLIGCLLFPARALIPGRPRTSQGTAPRLLPFVPSASSASATSLATAVRCGDFALSFLPTNDGWIGDSASAWKMLDCGNGRALLAHLRSQELVVADPISRRCIFLPAPPAQRAAGYGLLTDDGDSSRFRVVCISREGGTSPTLRALVLSAGEQELTWSEVAGLACQPNLIGSRPMQTSQSLYWKLEGGESMVEFNAATMQFSLLQLPPSLRDGKFDVVEKGNDEEGSKLHLLTMKDFCIEVWGRVGDGEGGTEWRRVEKSVRFFHVMMDMFKLPSERYLRKLDIVAVAAGLLFMRQRDRLFAIDLETMKLRTVSDSDCANATIYPYAIAWPPTFLNPAGDV